MQVSVELVKAHIEDNDAAGGHQLQREATVEEVVGQIKTLQASEVAQRWCDGPFKASIFQRDLNDRPVSIADDAFPFAAVFAFLPKLGKAGILQEPSKELEEGVLLLLCATTGGGGQGDQQQNSKAKQRYG